MSQWFGIRGYTMKNSIMDYACSFETELKFAKEMAGHTQVSTTKIYAKASLFGALKKMVNTIIIPRL
jgi:site-specific recombinase XerD